MTTPKSYCGLGPDQVGTILDSVADGVFTVDNDFVITSFNKAAERITGFADDEAIGEKCYNIFRSPACQTECLLNECARRGKPITGLELSILNRRNDEVPISVSTSVLRDESGNVIGGVGTFRDLTAVETHRREVRRKYAFHEMLSKNARMQEIFEIIPDIATSSAAVLIQGETGTGKEPLAQAIHDKSPRAEQTFIKVNCGALPDALLESKLFGHVVGAFTDARTDRKGRFELADRGTVFLDEIGDTSPAMQVKLLRVLQEGMFEPVGSSQSRRTDVRVIAATHHDLRELCSVGRFRADLFYRINTVMLRLPPLRERREDIPLLIEHFIERFNKVADKKVRLVERSAMRALLAYAWPGNVRELEHAIEHAFILVKGPDILLEHLPEEIAAGQGDLQREESPATRATTPVPSAPSTPAASLQDAERLVITQALERHRWNRLAACRELGISRTTLWRKMRHLGILTP